LEPWPRLGRPQPFVIGDNTRGVPMSYSQRISDYSDKTITHSHSPRTYRGTAICLNTGEAMISTHRLYPERAADAPRQSETPRTLLPLIENYVDDLVAFLATNRDKANLAAGLG
jgi:hypothetical protein